MNVLSLMFNIGSAVQPFSGLREKCQIRGWLNMPSVCRALFVCVLALSCYGQQERPPSGAPVTPVLQPHDNLRDPFWPADYVRPMQPGERPDSAAKIGETEWRTLEKLLRESVKGVSRLPTRNGRDEFTVLINGRMFGIGDLVSLAANGKNYRWRVVSVTLRDGPVFERAIAGTESSASPPSKN